MLTEFTILFCISLLFTCIFCIFTFFFGKLLFGTLLTDFQSPYTRFFISFGLGLITVVSGFAIFITSFNSILLFALVLIIYLIFSSGRLRTIAPEKLLEKADLMPMIHLLSFFTALSILQLIRLDIYNDKAIYLGWIDYNIYSDLSEYMLLNKNERSLSWHQYFNSEMMTYSVAASPYHYFEIWLHGILLYISKIKGALAFNFITIPLVNSLCYSGFLAIGHHFLKQVKSWWLFCLCGLFVFYIGVFPFKFGGLLDNAFFYPRTISFYLIFTLSMLFISKEKYHNGLTILLLLPFFNILYSPTILTIVFLITILLRFHNKPNDAGFVPIALSFMTAAAIVFFYLFINRSDEANAFSTKDLMGGISLNHIVYTYFRLYLFRLWFFYIPLTLFVVFYYRRILNWITDLYKIVLIVMALFLFFLSIFFVSIVPHMESGTIASIIINPLISIISFTALMFVLREPLNWKKRIFVFLFSSFATYSLLFTLIPHNWNRSYFGEIYSIDFIKNASDAVSKIKNKIGGQIQNTGRSRQSVFANHPLFSRHATFFDFYESGLVQVSLSTPKSVEEIPFEQIHDYIKYAPFYRFVQYQKSKGQFLNLQQSQVQFVKQYKIDYLIVEPGAVVSDSMKELVVESVKDSVTGHLLLILKID